MGEVPLPNRLPLAGGPTHWRTIGANPTEPNGVKPFFISELYRNRRKRSQRCYPVCFQALGAKMGPEFAPRMTLPFLNELSPVRAGCNGYAPGTAGLAPKPGKANPLTPFIYSDIQRNRPTQSQSGYQVCFQALVAKKSLISVPKQRTPVFSMNWDRLEVLTVNDPFLLAGRAYRSRSTARGEAPDARSEP